jgi:hypothetical protein
VYGGFPLILRTEGQGALLAAALKIESERVV